MPIEHVFLNYCFIIALSSCLRCKLNSPACFRLCCSPAQRRRWLNGSFFSLVYFVSKFHNLLGRSDHSWFRRLGLMVQFFYQVSTLVMAWFAVGSLYLSLVVIFNLALDRLGNTASTEIMWVFSLSYGFLTFLQVSLCLRNTCDLPCIRSPRLDCGSC